MTQPRQRPASIAYVRSPLPGAVLSAVLLSSAAGAQDRDGMEADAYMISRAYTEEFFFQEYPAIASVTRLPQSKAQTPASVTVIDRSMIEASGFTEIVDLLRLVPGFQVAHADGRLHVATYHGQSSQYQARFQVLVDGRSVYLPLLSNVDWTVPGVHMDDIERIEVIRGPNAPAYGSNAFLGTINILTRQPFMDRGGRVAIGAGDPGMRRFVARHGGSIEGMDYRITGSYRTSDGFKDRDDGYELGGLYFRGSLALGPADELELQLGMDSGHTGADGDESNPLNPVRKRNVDSHHQQLVWRHRTPADNDLTVQFYHNHYRHDDRYTIATPLSGILGVPPEWIPLLFDGQPDQHLVFALFHGTADRYDIELQHSSEPRQGLRLAWGAGLRQDRLRSEFLLGSAGNFRDSSERLFLNGELSPRSDITVNLGLMVEHGDIIDTQYSPRVAINWTATPGQMLRASISAAHRSPALLDNHWDYAARLADGTVLDQRHIADEPLDSERIISYEIGHIAEFPDRYLTIETKLFRERIRDILTLARDATYPDPMGNGAALARNGGRIDTQGIEGQILYRPASHSFIAFQYSYAEIKARTLRQLNPDTFRSRDDATPSHTLSLLASHRFDSDLQLSTGLYRVAEQRWLGDGDLLPAYNRVDIRLAQGFQAAAGRGEVSFVLQNISSEYASFRDENLFDTRAFLQLAWTQK